MNKVVVTGIGLVTPLGVGKEKTWAGLLNEESGIAHDKEYGNFLSARVADFMIPKEAKLLSMSFLAAAEAVKDSELDFSLIDMTKFGCTVSVSKPVLSYSSDEKIVFSEAFMQDFVGKQLYRIFKLRGPVKNISAACATGADSIISAANLIKQGVCDYVLAGAVESSFHPLYIAGFKQMGVLAADKVCPFDKNRQGFALGEGAGILLLERKDFAMLRGAKIYGEISGCAMSNDAYNPIAFNTNGESIYYAIKKAMSEAQIDAVDYINAHGTATVLNDMIETKAIKKFFGAKTNNIAVSSTKAATGHLLGASGAVEIAFSLLALRDGRVPPTLNLTQPDVEFDLDYVPNHSRYINACSAMSLSFGFGGQIGVVVVTK